MTYIFAVLRQTAGWLELWWGISMAGCVIHLKMLGSGAGSQTLVLAGSTDLSSAIVNSITRGAQTMELSG